jgi:hypothetical protein
LIDVAARANTETRFNAPPHQSELNETILVNMFHFSLRAAASLPFLKELQRFDIASHPATSVACYLVACPLPGLDFHQQADNDFSEHASRR